ncbi:MAG: tyrosine-protein phosphatase [Isosphaeraceae bacterium]
MDEETQIDRRERLGRSRRRRVVAIVVCTLLALLAYAFRGPLFGGNFGVVHEQRVYRSAQPRSGLAALIRERRLTSILNLRGGSPRDSWYADEVRACRAGDVDFYDLPMSATARPSRRDLLRLIDLFGRCRYPLLIHCKSGADRTGLVAALYRMVAQGVDPRRAETSFTIAYGHVPLFGTQRLHEPLREYADWLDARGSRHTPERFRAWVANEYVSPDTETDLPTLRPGTREPSFEALIFPEGSSPSTASGLPEVDSGEQR